MFSISVIVPTRNRVLFLKKCIQSLSEQSHQNFKIIIIDDCSDDSTRDYLKNLLQGKIKIIYNKKQLGPSRSRNIGVKAAKSELVAFIDDDCWADRDWLTELDKRFIDKDIYFVIGQTFYIKKGYQGYFPERLVNNIDAKWPMGCNIAYRKSIFKAIGFFNSSYDKYHNEDSEFAIRAVAKHFKFIREKEAVVFHQACNWTVKSILSSARNLSVWPLLKRKYPQHFLFFDPPVSFGIFINIKEYCYIIILPVLILFLLIRYIIHGKRDLKIFFAKWPVYLLLKRYYIYLEAIKNKKIML